MGSAVRRGDRSNNHLYKCVSHLWPFEHFLSQGSRSSSDYKEVDIICSKSRSMKFTGNGPVSLTRRKSRTERATD